MFEDSASMASINGVARSVYSSRSVVLLPSLNTSSLRFFFNGLHDVMNIATDQRYCDGIFRICDGFLKIPLFAMSICKKFPAFATDFFLFFRRIIIKSELATKLY